MKGLQALEKIANASRLFSWFDEIGRSPNILKANFAQTWASAAFGKGGPLAGRSIDEVADALRNGTMATSDLPIGVIVREGNTLVLNTRSALALGQADIARSVWNVVDQTGDEFFERLLTRQLAGNGLDASGIADVVVRGLR